MSWSVPRMWDGGDVWIIGGGPSVSKQFGIPDKVIQSVISGISPPSTFSPYMKCIHDKHVIGINAAYLLGDWIDIIFFGDKGFFLNHSEALSKHSAIKISCWPSIEGRYTYVKALQRDSNKKYGITKNPYSVSWNGHSGAAAISVAAHAGAKRIFLLGFDMNLNGAGNRHWHNTYDSANDGQKPRNKLPFDRHLRGFPQIAADAKKLGIQILNVNPESAIDCFPKITLKDFMPL